MIRKFFLPILLFFIVASNALADNVTIIEIKGQVLVRQDVNSQWINAAENMQLEPNTEIKTIGNSQCTVAFDKNRQNIITVKDHTQIRIDSVVPGSVYLPEGRVFSLIKNIRENKNFEVRTPTAVSGARGTGWLTEVVAGETSISCFDDVVYVNTMDPEGRIVSQVDVPQGGEISVKENRVNEKDIKEIKPDLKREWNVFFDKAQSVAVPDPGRPRPNDGKPGGPKNPEKPGEMTPPPHGDLPQPPKEGFLPHGGGQGPNDAFNDAQHEANQTMLDHPPPCACMPPPHCGCHPTPCPCPPPPPLPPCCHTGGGS